MKPCCTLFYAVVLLAPRDIHPYLWCNLTSSHFQAAPTLSKVNTTERLKELRQKMQQEGVQAYIIPSVDQHMVTCFDQAYYDCQLSKVRQSLVTRF